MPPVNAPMRRDAKGAPLRGQDLRRAELRERMRSDPFANPFYVLGLTAEPLSNPIPGVFAEIRRWRNDPVQAAKDDSGITLMQSGAANIQERNALAKLLGVGEIGLGTLAMASLLPGIPGGKAINAGAKAGGRQVSKAARNQLRALAQNPPRNMQQLPSLRGMLLDDGLFIASRDPHLIVSGDGSPGYFVGGPEQIQSVADLRAQRAAMDARLANELRGYNWYDRTRNAIAEVTGNNPQQSDWMSAQDGQWSAQASPEGELGFALRENNASLMGMPVTAKTGAQHRAHERAIAANDPSLYQLGQKTGEYAVQINPETPNRRPLGATGVNDFRWAREHGFTDPSGGERTQALTSAQHTYVDYETAQAVNRALRRGIGSNSGLGPGGGAIPWTGERLQAALWVNQKTQDYLRTRKYRETALAEVRAENKRKNSGLSEAEIAAAAEARAYERAFADANSSIADYFPKHTASATYEAQPGPATGHLPLAANADAATRQAFFDDPLSRWATAPGGRDAIYGGLSLNPTGVAARVRPTTPMQGFYTTDAGRLELNPGEVARPLIAFETAADQTKSIAPADRAMLSAAERLRAAIDAQESGAAHINFLASGPQSNLNSMMIGRLGASNPQEMLTVQGIGQRYGLGDVSDRGEGLTLTQFYPGPPKLTNQQRNALLADLAAAGFETTAPSKVDSVYESLTDQWKEGVGSGAVTRQVLAGINVTPEARAAFNNNPHIASVALNRVARDEKWAQVWGPARQDLQNLRRIIGSGAGWVDRLEAALKSGQLLPAVAGPFLAALALQQQERSVEGEAPL